MYVYYLHFYFYLISTLSQGITDLQNNYQLSLHPVYKPMAQDMCSLRSAVSELCEHAKKKIPAITLISLFEVATYFLYPAEEDHIDNTIVAVDNGMTQVIGSTSVFLVGHLLRVIENDITNVILPLLLG